MTASNKSLTLEDLQTIVDSVDELIFNPGPMDIEPEDFVSKFIPSLANVSLFFDYRDLNEMNPAPDFFHFDQRSFNALVLILNRWMVTHTDKIMMKLGSRILVDKHRLLILGAISGNIPSQYRVEILETVLPIINNISNDEVEALIWALAENNTSETTLILQKVQELLVKPAKTVSVLLSGILSENS